jgi:signal transduction histidine kinase/DNA-binding NarL/FixJ family response regulator
VAALGQRFFVFVRDISERVRLEEQLRNQQVHLEVLVQKRTADLEQALEAAQLADHAKDAFLANVSHELRTPLNAVIGMSDLARRLSHDPAQQAYLDKVGNAGQTLAHLIDDLLDLSKIVAGRMEFENATFSLRALVERSNSVMSYKATEKGLQLTEQIADDLPDLLIGDPHRIEQILLNLLSNAIKFTASGHIDIRINALEQQAERLCLAIEVQDTGVGLSHEEIDRLFKPFAQADASMTRKYGGSGLGLAICKRLAEMMDGQINVSSQPGHGSTFRVILWLRLGKAEDLHPNQLTGQRTGPLSSQPSLPASYRDTRILVVDDQALNREIVEALLKFVGITPRMASDGQQALDLLDANGPDAFDLVLMDIQMPVMDGLSATRELRNRKGFQALPIIAMTAHTMEHEKEISTQAGMNDHIGKPFDNASFYRTLAKWIPQAKHQADHILLDPVEQRTPPPADSFPILNGIDSASGIARLAGNEERYRHWLTDFVEEGPATARQIRQTLAAGNNEAARQLAHAFKGRVGMLGMNEVHRVTTELEAALKRGDPVEGWLNKLEQVIEQTRHDIKRTLNLPDYAPPAEVLHEQSPQGPVPEAVAQLVELLEAGDGASAAAIARCLNEYKETDWAPRLQRALSHAQNFDFAAATKALLADGGGWYEV